MATIVLRSGKGSPLTNTEVDANFSNLNTGKLELGGTYSSGTANGVTYLNGSKVLTSGSALTFDGSVFSVTGAISATTTINGALNGTVGASTPSTGAFTSLSASGTSTLAAVNASGAVTGNKALLALGDAAFLASSTVPSYRWHISSGGITADRNIYEMRAYNAGGTDHALQIRTVNDANTTVKTIALFSDTYGLAVTGAISASGAAGTSFINLAGAGNAAPPAGVYYGLFPQATFGLGLVSRTDAGIALWAGATPVQRATISSTGLAVTGAITANSAAATAPFIASINGGEAMRINSAGNVGIGTSSPTSKLDVTGAGRFNSSGEALTVGSSSLAANTAQYFRNTSGYSVLALASASNQYLTGVVAGDFIIGSNAKSLRFGNAGTGALQATIDSSGNLGLGVTPSAWYSTVKAIQVGSVGGAFVSGNTVSGGSANLGLNTYFDAATAAPRYGANSFASYYSQFNGAHIWYNAPSGTAGNAISFTQAMTLDASGNLGIGVTNPRANLEVSALGGATIRISNSSLSSAAGDLIGGLDYYSEDADTRTVRAYVRSYVADGFGRDGYLTFGTTAVGGTVTERARIDSSGNLLVGTTSGNAKLLIYQSTQGSVQALAGPGGNQGTPNFITVVKQLPAVSAGTQIIIPFVSQGSINTNTIVRIRGVSAQYNTNNPKPFVCEFAVGHLLALHNLTSWNLQGVTSVTTSGLNVVITLSAAAYTGATSNGVFITLEYLSSFVSLSINVENIAMN